MVMLKKVQFGEIFNSAIVCGINKVNLMGCVGLKPEHEGKKAEGGLVNEASAVRRQQLRNNSVNEEEKEGKKVENKPPQPMKEVQKVEDNPKPAKIEEPPKDNKEPDKQRVKEPVKIQLVVPPQPPKINEKPKDIDPGLGEEKGEKKQQQPIGGRFAKFQEEGISQSMMKGGSIYIEKDEKDTPKLTASQIRLQKQASKYKSLRQTYPDFSESDIRKMMASDQPEEKKDHQKTQNNLASKHENRKVADSKPEDKKVDQMKRDDPKIVNNIPEKGRSEIKNKIAIKGSQGSKPSESKKLSEIKEAVISSEEASKRSKVSDRPSEKQQSRKESSLCQFSVKNQEPRGQYVIGPGSSQHSSESPNLLISGVNQSFHPIPKPMSSFLIPAELKSRSSIKQASPSSSAPPPPTNPTVQKKILQIEGIYPVKEQWVGQIQGFYNPFIDSAKNSKLVNRVPVSMLRPIPNEPQEEIYFLPFSFASSIRGNA